MLRVVVDTYEDIAQYIKDEKETFTNAIISAIKRGWKEKLPIVEVVEFIINDENDENDVGSLVISIDEDDWSESLHLALNHFESVEDVTPFSFYRYVTNLYSNFITDENITVWKMVEEWYDSKNEKSYGEVIKYLDDNVSVSLGPTNWVVMVNNKEWSCKHLIAVFNRHDKQSIKLIYHDWYGNKVKELSEEMLNKSYY